MVHCGAIGGTTYRGGLCASETTADVEMDQIKSNFISIAPFVQNVQYKVLNNTMKIQQNTTMQ